jgi:hypothetical protein
MSFRSRAWDGYYTPADRLYAVLWRNGEQRAWVDDGKNEMGALENAHFVRKPVVERNYELSDRSPKTTIQVPQYVKSLWVRGVSAQTQRPVRLWIYCRSGITNGPGLVEVPFDPRSSVTLRRPRPGTWTILVDEADDAGWAGEIADS